MATVRSSLRQRASLPGSAAKIISDVNRQLVKDVEDSGQFMTMFLLALDTATRQLEMESGKHETKREKCWAKSQSYINLPISVEARHQQ